MLSAWIFYLPGREYNALEAAVYGSLHRVGWSLGISWIVFAVCTGGKGRHARTQRTFCDSLIHLIKIKCNLEPNTNDNNYVYGMISMRKFKLMPKSALFFATYP
jgi:hypothetical protein